MGAELRSGKAMVIAHRPAQLAWVWAGPRSLGSRDLGLQSAQGFAVSWQRETHGNVFQRMMSTLLK